MRVVLSFDIEEHEYVRCPTGTCGNGARCVYITMFNGGISGKALSPYGIPNCILCERRGGQRSHYTIQDGYPREMIKNNKVRFEVGDYSGTPLRTRVEGRSSHPMSWVVLSTIVTASKTNGVTPFVLYICGGKKCSGGKSVKNHIDQKYSFGSNGIYMDLAKDKLYCKGCRSPITEKKGQCDRLTGNWHVEHEGQLFSRCFCCGSVTSTHHGELLPFCSQCEKDGQYIYKNVIR